MDTYNLFRLAAAILALTGGIDAAAASEPSWTGINAGITGASFGMNGLTVDPANPSTIYGVTNSGNAFKSTDSAGTWKPVRGVWGVASLTVDPTNSSTIYASSSHGIFKSTDGSDTWNSVNAGLNGTPQVSKVVVDPFTPSTLYSLVNAGIYKSADGGGNWGAIASIPAATGPIVGLSIDPVTPSTLYAVDPHGNIFKTTDGAVDWISIYPGSPNAGFGDVLQLAIDPQTPSTVYAGSFAGWTTPSGAFTGKNGTVSKSTDGGRTWTTLQAGIPSDAFVNSLVIDPAAPSTIYGSYSRDGGVGIIKSLDGGQNWTIVNASSQHLSGARVAVGGGSPSTVYAAYSQSAPGGGSMLKSTDGGATWNPANGGLDYFDLRTVKFDPVHSGTVYTVGAGGVYRSKDNGASWSGLDTFQVPASPSTFGFSFPAGDAIVRSLLIDYMDPDNLYLSVTRADGCVFNDGLFFKSTDDGATWSSGISPIDSGCVASGLLGRAGGFMAMDPTNPKVLYLDETDEGDQVFSLLKSTDGGANWNSIWSSFDQVSGVYALLIDPNNPALLYAGVGDQNLSFTGGTGTGLFKSIDGGATWNYAGLQNSAVTVLAMDPANSAILYAGTQGLETSPIGFRGLFKSLDSGATWTSLNTGLTHLTDVGAAISALVIAPGQSDILYAATSGDGIYKSSDGGSNWTRFSCGLTSLDVRALAFAPGLPNTLYAATAGGIFTIVDGGSATK